LIVELEKTLEFSYKVIELMRLKIPAFERLVEIESELRSNTKENIEIQLENVVALRQHLQSQPACVKNFERLNKIENNLENLFILYRKITREQQSRNNQHLAAHRHYLKQDEQFSKIIQNSLSSIKNIEKLQPTFPDMTVIIDKMNKNLGDLIAERQELEAKRTVVMASKDNLAQEEYYQRAVQFKSLCHDLESWQTALISRAT
jgi:hypothetical protein